MRQEIYYAPVSVVRQELSCATTNTTYWCKNGHEKKREKDIINIMIDADF